MHKRIPVADVEIDSETANILSIPKLHNIEHIPIGFGVNDWWLGRSIPASRNGIREALEAMNISSTKVLLEKCLGLGLSDQYWINNPQKSLEWERINFFENTFSEDVGNALFGKTPNAEIDLFSLKKRIEMLNQGG